MTWSGIFQAEHKPVVRRWTFQDTHNAWVDSVKFAAEDVVRAPLDGILRASLIYIGRASGAGLRK